LPSDLPIRLASPGEENPAVLAQIAHTSPCPQAYATQEAQGAFLAVPLNSSKEISSQKLLAVTAFSPEKQLEMPPLKGEETQAFITLASPLPRLWCSLSANGFLIARSTS